MLLLIAVSTFFDISVCYTCLYFVSLSDLWLFAVTAGSLDGDGLSSIAERLVKAASKVSFV